MKLHYVLPFLVLCVSWLLLLHVLGARARVAIRGYLYQGWFLGSSAFYLWLVHVALEGL